MDGRQADESAAGIGVQQGAALAHQVRQEDEAVGANRRLLSLLIHQDVGIGVHFLGSVDLSLAESIAVPLQGQTGSQRAAHHGVGTGNGSAEGVYTALRIDLHLVGVSEHNTGCADGGEGLAFHHNAGTHSSSGIVTSAASNGSASDQTGHLSGFAGDIASHVRAFGQAGHQVIVDVQGIEDLLGPAAVGHVQQVGAAGVAHFGSVLAGQLEAHIVLGQQNVANLGPQFRLVLAHPQDLTSGEAGESGVGGDLDQTLTADGVGDLVALVLSTAIAPQNGFAQHVAIRIQQHQTMHLAADTQTLDVGSIHAALLDDGADGVAGSIPPIFGSLLSPAVLGLMEGIFDGFAGNRLAVHIEQHGFGTGSTKVNTK